MARPPKTPKINHGGNRTRMDGLDDHMLTQILFRLPNCKTVLACSPVNKRWCSLISDPTFSAQFTNHKKKITTLLKGSGSGSDHEDDEAHWNLIATMQSSQQWVPLITKFMFGFRELSLEFLPCKTCTTTVTFKDLVLCSNYWTYQEHGRLVYYITNPITKQWVALPPCPVYKHRWEQERIKRTALICQQPYIDSSQHYKFRVVEVRNTCIDSSQETLGLVVYCSEIGEWKEINLRVPKEEFRQLETTVVCNGIIYFKSGLSLVGLDPFDVNDTCDTTLEARVMPPLPDFGCLQESSGQLLIINSPKRCSKTFVCYSEDRRVIELEMEMWKLDLNQARLAWEMTFRGVCKGTWKGRQLQRNIALEGDLIEVHPYNDKLIYMFLPTKDWFVLCDTQTGYITPLKSVHRYSLSRIHRLEHQWWPTSVPALVQ
ncbi:F-box protein At5g07610-like [Silene latifolia]|uniref:F-box protein At5g07610-like n=1 Tax=Silene latifolia TaxID=37657 RepID=UPI003D778594